MKTKFAIILLLAVFTMFGCAYIPQFFSEFDLRQAIKTCFVSTTKERLKCLKLAKIKIGSLCSHAIILFSL